ncbi:hypothetical protein KSP39_PZI009185 [Platanthera zijinensis]|uniref:RRM domain-containing protein n=1 Tax=Platanthera zijinensis TaxID=2320716 RepID=A0AAP0BKN3_9ASPA
MIRKSRRMAATWEEDGCDPVEGGETLEREGVTADAREVVVEESSPYWSFPREMGEARYYAVEGCPEHQVWAKPIGTDMDTMTLKGCGFVTFRADESMLRALEEMRNRIQEGRTFLGSRYQLDDNHHGGAARLNTRRIFSFFTFREGIYIRLKDNRDLDMTIVMLGPSLLSRGVLWRGILKIIRRWATAFKRCTMLILKIIRRWATAVKRCIMLILKILKIIRRWATAVKHCTMLILKIILRWANAVKRLLCPMLDLCQMVMNWRVPLVFPFFFLIVYTIWFF